MFSGLEAIDVRSGRRWTALTSFVLQGILVSAALVLPLLRPSNLPEAFAKRRIFVPLSAGEPPIHPSPGDVRSSSGAYLRPVVVRPDFSLRLRYVRPETGEAVIAPSFSIGNGPGGPDGVVGSTPGSYVQPVYHPAPAEKPRPVSIVMEGNLIQRVQPQYPAIARQIRLQGDVVIRAVISRAGTIAQTTVVSGPGLLAPSALDAVRQWKYRPYYLNGEPVEVETQITVKFILNQ